MKTVKFAKMAGAGNDFIIVRSGDLPAVSLPLLAKKMCDRKFGIGADGLLLLEKSRKADIRMRVINADGSEAQMCGNGARCVAFYANRQSSSRGRHIRIETAAGIILSQVEGDDIKVKLTEPVNLKLDIPVKVGSRTLRVNFVNTGVPHTVVFVQGIDEINVEGLGRYIRYHRRFFPSGTNVNFVEVSGKRSIKIRT
ncbi:MAG: diaminopimelate epimerase, partial [Deltaproteobacteria bacterium]